MNMDDLIDTFECIFNSSLSDVKQLQLIKNIINMYLAKVTYTTVDNTDNIDYTYTWVNEK